MLPIRTISATPDQNRYPCYTKKFVHFLFDSERKRPS